MKADHCKFMKAAIEEAAKSLRECKDMMAGFICKSPDLWYEDIGK